MHELVSLAHEVGFVTSADALSRGFGRNTLRRLSSSGALVRTSFGVYLAPGDRTPEARHALMTRALLHLDPYSVASHHSALALLGVALYGVPLQQVHLADARCSSRRHESVHRHVLRGGDVVRTLEGGLRCIEPAHAALQVAARYGPASGIVSLDAALRAALCTDEDLERVLRSGRIRRGLRLARHAAEHADGRAESPGESLLRGIVAGMPWSYDLQVNVGGPGRGYRVDILVEECVAVEFDGNVKYQGADGPKALIDEKRREDYLRGLKFEVVRVVWADLRHPTTVQRAIHDALVRARTSRRVAA
nr:type IV toxin-antitoxin system AbiEi family antitoxin domain-containing protein [Propionibacterium sp.]